MITIFTYKNLTYMKRLLQISGMAFLIMLFTGLRNTASAQPGGYVSYQTFYDELSPYGRWIDYPEYGYVWCPDEGSDFRPYSTNGHWVWSDDYEWMWVSDYNWGWAPFHYGRWFYDDIYGWLWMPGYEWSPAWVAWRTGGDYYGWAPLRPGISISIGFSIGSYAPPVNYWCFAPSRYITSPRIYDYCVSSRQNVTIINNTTIINNYNYNRNVFVTGPRRVDAERYTRERINSVRVRDISSPGRAGFRNNEVSVYRPSIQRENNNRQFAPRRFDEFRGSNRVAERNSNQVDRSNRVNDRFQRNNDSRVDGRNAERRNIFNNNDRVNSNNNSTDRLERRNEVNNQERVRQFDQRQNNNNTDRINRRDNPVFNRQNNNTDNNQDRLENNRRQLERRNEVNAQQERARQFERQNNSSNGARERSVRDVFGSDNRRGFDRPAPQPRFERQEQPVRNNDINRREWNRDNSNRGFSNNNAPQAQERRSAFERRDVPNNRTFNQQPQQQRQSFPDINRRQEQPRQFSQPNRGGNDNGNRGGFGHRRG